MIALKETTLWKDGKTVNHTYLLDGDKLVAYIRQGHTEPFYFKQPIKGFSRSHRKFVELQPSPFAVTALVATPSHIRQVAGSRPGVMYQVDTDAKTCTCPGYTFRGACKHVKELA